MNLRFDDLEELLALSGAEDVILSLCSERVTFHFTGQEQRHFLTLAQVRDMTAEELRDFVAYMRTLWF